MFYFILTLVIVFSTFICHAEGTKKFTDLPEASAFTGTELFAVSQEVAGASASRSATPAVIVKYVGKDLSNNKIPKWNGSELTNSTVTEVNDKVGIGTTAPSRKAHIVGDVWLPSASQVYTSYNSNLVAKAGALQAEPGSAKCPGRNETAV